MIIGPGSESGHSAGPAAGQSGDGSGGRGRGQHRAQVRDYITDNDNHHYDQSLSFNAQVRDVSCLEGARSYSHQHPGLGWGKPGEARGKK